METQALGDSRGMQDSYQGGAPRKYCEKVEFFNLPYSSTSESFTELVKECEGFVRAYLKGARGYALFNTKEEADSCVRSMVGLKVADHDIVAKTFVFRSFGGFPENQDSRYFHQGGPRGGYSGPGMRSDQDDYRPRQRTMNDGGYRNKMEPYQPGYKDMNGRFGGEQPYGGSNYNTRQGGMSQSGGRYDRPSFPRGGGMGGDNMGSRPPYRRYPSQSSQWGDQAWDRSDPSKGSGDNAATNDAPDNYGNNNSGYVPRSGNGQGAGGARPGPGSNSSFSPGNPSRGPNTSDAGPSSAFASTTADPVNNGW